MTRIRPKYDCLLSVAAPGVVVAAGASVDVLLGGGGGGAIGVLDEFDEEAASFWQAYVALGSLVTFCLRPAKPEQTSDVPLFRILNAPSTWLSFGKSRLRERQRACSKTWIRPRGKDSTYLVNVPFITNAPPIVARLGSESDDSEFLDRIRDPEVCSRSGAEIFEQPSNDI